MESKKVLVAGATGYLGQFLVKELKQRGYWVRVLIRNKNQIKKFKNVDDFFVGEITNPNSLIGVAHGMDWVFSTVGITRQKDGVTYMDVDYRGNSNLLTESIKSDVKSFLYVSAINGDKMKSLKIFEAKERFVSELKKSGVNYTIMRPNGFFSDMRDFLDMAKGGRVYLFGKGEHKLNPIHGADLAKVCVSKMESGIREVTVGGKDLFTQNELATLALKAWDKPIKITHLPDWTRKAIINLLRTFTSSKTYGPIEFFMTAMGNDNIADAYGTHSLKEFFNSEVKRMQK